MLISMTLALLKGIMGLILSAPWNTAQTGQSHKLLHEYASSQNRR